MYWNFERTFRGSSCFLFNFWTLEYYFCLHYKDLNTEVEKLVSRLCTNWVYCKMPKFIRSLPQLLDGIWDSVCPGGMVARWFQRLSVSKVGGSTQLFVLHASPLKCRYDSLISALLSSCLINRMNQSNLQSSELSIMKSLALVSPSLASGFRGSCWP